MLRDGITPVKICNYSEALAWSNGTGKNYLISRNPKIKNLFPLTENFLRRNYIANNFLNFKKSYPDIYCANDTIGILVATYGYLPGGSNDGGANQAQSSGLNPLFGFPFNAGFDFGIGAYNLLWILLGIGAVYFLSKDK
jgi:hypothetical protein